ncbi:meiotic nuclear division protein 1, partial [Kockiozyma suomiensis]|uniref:meiotic nuclear division protein 1 n=1 Tax=Kockiozyma suomiensis TaxID=1337062 RepID=UPI0033438447
SRKGISAAEKSTRLLSFFQDSLSFFAIKEIERQGSKVTGINSMQIKDVLQGLVDEGLVRCEKIGSGNYYWSFPSETTRIKELKLVNLQQKLESETKDINSLVEKIALETQDRIPSPHRDALIQRVNAKESKILELTVESSKFSDIDPELLQQQQNTLILVKTAVNRWTDNIFALMGYFRAQGTDMQIVYSEFGIPQELDSV